MRNYELIREIYELCREEEKCLDRFEGYVRQGIGFKVQQLIEQQRPELQDEVQ